jgi:uncharacterized iron-regulated membrane protein
MIQLIDLRSIFTKAPADDPNVEAMWEDYYGPGGYAIIAPKDYTAPAFSTDADLHAMLAQTMQSARLTAGQIPLQYVELRYADGKPVGIVSASGRLAEFDAVNGQIISSGPIPRPARPAISQFHQSPRNMFKVLHRMTLFGNYALIINVIVGLGLFVMIVTGILMYFTMLSRRRKAGKGSPFWSGGGRWRTWHRRISIVSTVFLAIVAFTGLWLAYESLYFGFYLGSAEQRADNQAFATHLVAIAPHSPTVKRLEPLTAEAQPGRLASMQQDVGLSDDELVKVKIIDDSFIAQMDALRKSADPDQLRGQSGTLHKAEADRFSSMLSPDKRPKFQAWRDAQLLGLPAEFGPGPQGPLGPQGSQPGPPAFGGPGGPHGLNGPRMPGGPGGPGGGFNPFGGPDSALPIADSQLPSMLIATLTGMGNDWPGTPIRVIRLRNYAGMLQGAVVTGGKETTQLVFNAQTGRMVSETEPGYPPVGFPFGWQAHQLGKAIHRGSIIGLSGRFMDLFAGLAMLYLSISGIVIYIDYWKKKKQSRLLARRALERVA